MRPVEPPTSRSMPESVPRKRGPIIALLLLAPIISEVIYGATRLSTIFVLIPEILTWGCGALLIRECVRRWRKGWPSMLLMGLALAVAEEWVIQQTSIAPLVGLAKHTYGRLWGVNLVYFLWALGYESVWVVLIPVELTELLFPQQRHESWLRTRGMVIATVAFLIGAYAAWYGWTRRARVMIFHMPPYSPPPAYILGALVAIVGLLLAARFAPVPRPKAISTPSDWTVGATISLLGFPWAAFVLFGYGSFSRVPYQWALVVGAVWALSTLLLMLRWTSAHGWGVRQRYAVVFCGVVACSLGGFILFRVGGALRIDWIGKIVLDVIALLWLPFVRRRVLLTGN